MKIPPIRSTCCLAAGLVLAHCGTGAIAAPAAEATTTLVATPVVATGGPALGLALAVTAHDDCRDGSGSLRAWRIDPPSGTLADRPEWDSALRLDAALPPQRTMLTHDGRAGQALRWEALGVAQRLRLQDGDGAALGRQRLDWLRGDHSQEAHRGGLLRDRLRREDGSPFRQGGSGPGLPWPVGRPVARLPQAGLAAWGSEPDIANRPAMVYTTSHDGLLHGFDASDGSERLAYLPAGVLADVAAFARPLQTPRSPVDGPVFTADAEIQAAGARSRWATVLVGSPGGGGAGYFVLDASRPGRFSESAAEALVLLDTTAGRDPDIGRIVSPPVADDPGSGAAQVTRLNNGRWALLLGNGGGSARGLPVLLIQYLDAAREILRIAPTCPAAPAACQWRGGNGLSTPAPIDIDGNGSADIAYAGDLRGHLWKFDLSDSDARRWRIALGGAPFFTARDDRGRPQPIAAAPAWLPHLRGGVMLAFGTGRLPTPADGPDAPVHSLYGLHDDSTVTIDPPGIGWNRIRITGGSPINRPDDLRRPATLVVLRSEPAPPGLDGRRYARTGVDRGGQAPGTERGWRMDLPGPGEQLVQTPRSLGGQRLLFSTHTAEDGDFLTVIDAVAGTAPATATFVALEGWRPTTGSPDAGSANRVALESGGALPLVRDGAWWLLPAAGTRQPPIALRRGAGKPWRTGWRRLR